MLKLRERFKVLSYFTVFVLQLYFVCCVRWLLECGQKTADGLFLAMNYLSMDSDSDDVDVDFKTFLRHN